MTNCCVRAVVTGKVQGVWYRRATQEKALQYNITGYAKNLPDGRVEVLMCGHTTLSSMCSIIAAHLATLAPNRAIEGPMVSQNVLSKLRSVFPITYIVSRQANNILAGFRRYPRVVRSND